MDNPFAGDFAPEEEERKRFPWLGWAIAFVCSALLVFLLLVLAGVVADLRKPFLAPPPGGVVSVGGTGAASVIQYEVTGRGTVSVEYTDGKGVTRDRSVTLPWKKDATAEIFYVELKVTRVGPDSSPFECSVTSRGTLIGFGNADGPGAVCTAEGAQ